jgi:hypothetical protein
MIRLMKVAAFVILAGAGLTACASFDQPPTEFAEPDAMREGPGILTGERGSVVLQY